MTNMARRRAKIVDLFLMIALEDLVEFSVPINANKSKNSTILYFNISIIAQYKAFLKLSLAKIWE